MKKKTGWLDHPWLSALLALSWLLLSHSLAPVHLLSAALIGLLVPRLLQEALPPAPRIRAMPALRLMGIVLWDILVSNLVVARLVLGRMDRPQPAWVPVPLDLQHPTAIALFASIITTTPGTVSCTVDEQRRLIWVHALDCSDPAQAAADMKARYEAPLRDIFEAGPQGESA
ncbi:MAG: Na+/H+ antiporter subunit E [Hylemonella sp.]|jgi:multicomponent K+:H+ antiporter subunit E|uniref:Na+/H+ antiporter subunit E n=1 Tax=Hylemonella sp. TaxID=2066020 RepID=UPI00391D8093